MKSVLNHVALLIPNAVKTGEYLKSFDFKVGAAGEWEGEGTLEIYVGDLSSQMGNLLLMQPMKEGAYTRAMAKRGSGLHHIAVDVLDLEEYVDKLSGSGWLLHPKSLKTIKHSQTAYLARPGVPTLIEVQQRDTLSEFPYFITGMIIPTLSSQSLQMFKCIGLNQIQPSPDSNLTLTMNGKVISFKDLL